MPRLPLNDVNLFDSFDPDHRPQPSAPSEGYEIDVEAPAQPGNTAAQPIKLAATMLLMYAAFAGFSVASMQLGVFMLKHPYPQYETLSGNPGNKIAATYAGFMAVTNLLLALIGFCCGKYCVSPNHEMNTAEGSGSRQAARPNKISSVLNLVSLVTAVGTVFASCYVIDHSLDNVKHSLIALYTGEILLGLSLGCLIACCMGCCVACCSATSDVNDPSYQRFRNAASAPTDDAVIAETGAALHDIIFRR